eukprot:3161607-Pyramimonas_sp.AAC.1
MPVSPQREGVPNLAANWPEEDSKWPERIPRRPKEGPTEPQRSRVAAFTRAVSSDLRRSIK